MFTCPHCNTEAKTLIMTGLGYVGCYACSSNTKRTNDANYHSKAGLGGDAKNITITEKAHILNRSLGADGKTCVHKDNPSKNWSW